MVTLTLAVVLTLLSCSSALAAGTPEWRLDGALLPEAVAVSGQGNLTIANAGAKVEVECSGTIKGSILSATSAELTTWTTSGCTAIKTCENPVTVTMSHLPWSITLHGAPVEAQMTGSGGEPGYDLTCKVLGIQYEQQCRVSPLGFTTSNEFDTSLHGVRLASLPTTSLTCNGNKNAGSLTVWQAMEATKGGRLYAVSATEAEQLSNREWTQNGVSLAKSLTATWTSTETQPVAKFTDAHTGLTIECHAAGEGAVNPGRGGELTKLTLASCVGAGYCESAGATLEAQHLPWHSELVSDSSDLISETNDVFVHGGSMPRFKMSCKVLGIKDEEICSAQSVVFEMVKNGIALEAGSLASVLGRNFECGSTPKAGALTGSMRVQAPGGELGVT